MTWTEARSGAATATRQVAHDDRAKDRRDERTRSTTPKVRPRWLWPVVTGVLLVLVAGTGAVALASRGDHPSPETTTGAKPRPTGGGGGAGTKSESPAAAVGGEPLSGDLTAVGSVDSTSNLGTDYSFEMTVRLACADSCTVTVVKAPGQYAPSFRALIGRKFAPSGGGAYQAAIDDPLRRFGGQIQPGCDGLQVRGKATLVRAGDVVTLTAQTAADSFKKPNGDRCGLADRTSVFTGTLS